MQNFENSKTLSESLEEALELKNLNIEKLAELTNISPYYLSSLLEGNFKNLPPVPYVKGYLAKIAEVLQLNNKVLWEIYEKEIALYSIKTSGPEDKLPSNRFVFQRSNKKVIIIAGLILFFLAVFLIIWQFDSLWGTPKIEIFNPLTDNFITTNFSIKLIGRIDNPKDKLRINNEEILVNQSGQFEKDFSLQPGINTVEFKIKRFLGEEIKIIKQVIYQP